jgi:hypothetical protein
MENSGENNQNLVNHIINKMKGVNQSEAKDNNTNVRKRWWTPE